MKGLGFLLRTAYTARNSSLPSGSFIADDEDLYFDREHFSAEAVGAWMKSISTGCPTLLADQPSGSEYRFPLKMTPWAFLLLAASAVTLVLAKKIPVNNPENA